MDSGSSSSVRFAGEQHWKTGSVTAVSLAYKEEGDTRLRCGPLYVRCSDGALASYSDSRDPGDVRPDGSKRASWYKLSDARKLARSTGLSLEHL